VVAHAYNPSYLGDADPEDHGSRPAQEKSLQTPSQPMTGQGGLCLSSPATHGWSIAVQAGRA
jgi:hypothetical protein